MSDLARYSSHLAAFKRLRSFGLTPEEANRLIIKQDEGYAFNKQEAQVLAQQHNRAKQIKAAQDFILLMNFHTLLARTKHEYK